MEVKTKKRVEFVDITREVENAVAKTKSGIVCIFTKHTTTGIKVMESETGLMRDYERALANVLPKPPYEHDRSHCGDGNADAHLKALFLPSSECIPVENGKPALGTWQRVFFVEMDGPKARQITIKVLEG
ncbi:hypothetical protein COT29_04445 [Candidatus Micrarchaeota archaeon CG08_land_8_20_14_0_20_59_11]|nr:MAG: hypothetical protein COT29_04445 [Candidatus Micrarchaeota archaeon CG08_land_8_20_14_0_20_59_11]PIT85243.1 MAG: hypothetical protein COU36_04410 [Candidatus Micrarchaeota archaeon CG10_big_fil_rev_8_21_14_0_10_59_7]